MQEEWKTIEGYEGLYQVSNLGRVKSFKYGKELILVTDRSQRKHGAYHRVTLSKEGNTKRYLVHRLVAQAFIPNRDNKPCIDHIDDNPSNNNVSNLRWVTSNENNNKKHHIDELKKANTGYKHTDNSKRKMSEYWKGKRSGKNNPTSKPVFKCTLNGEIICKYDSMSEGAKDIGKSTALLSKCLNKTGKPCGGYIWKYA